MDWELSFIASQAVITSYSIHYTKLYDLRELSKKCEFDLFSINADFAKNVIPASAEAVISCSHGDELNNLISDMSVMLKAEYPDAMPHITLTVGESEFAPMT